MCDDSSAVNVPREHQYVALVNVRNTEVATHWMRYNIQAALNLGLLVASLSAKDSIIGRNLPWTAIGGVILACIWVGFAVKSKQLFTERWEKHIKQYEKEFLPEEHRLFTNVEAEENKKGVARKHWDNLNMLAGFVPIVLIFVWITIGVYAYLFPPFAQQEQDLRELKSSIQKLSWENDRLKSEIEQLKNRVMDLTNGLQAPRTTIREDASSGSRVHRRIQKKNE